MSECEIRKGLQHAIFWAMWEKAKRWCNENPIEKLEVFKKNNINRISIGVETINDKFLRFLNRKHTKEEIELYTIISGSAVSVSPT